MFQNLLNTSHHPQLHLEIPKVSLTCIAIDMIGKLPTTSSGNKYALTCIDLLTSFVIAVPMLDKTAKSVVEAYLSGILSRAGASMVCLSDNGSELKNTQMNTVLKQLGTKCIFPMMQGFLGGLDPISLVRSTLVLHLTLGLNCQRR